MNMKRLLAALMVASAAHTALPFAPTNLFAPYASSLRLPSAPKKCAFRVGANGEYGQTNTGKNADGRKANVLNLFETSQSVLAALEQPTTAVATTDFIATRNALHILGAYDDGTRGHIALQGKFEQWDVTPHVSYKPCIDAIPGALSLSAALPVRGMRVYDVKLTDKTTGILPVDVDVQSFLTTDMVGNAKKYGNLEMKNWDGTGLGDLAVTLGWSNDYPQTKDSLENVELHAFVGFTAPTSERKNEDKAFAMALGHDGAWTMPIGLGLDLDFKHHIALGAEAQFEIAFNDTKVRRVKTDVHQTEFLLLNKSRVTTDHGLTWKFNVYAQAYHFLGGFSLKAAYEYIKHEADRLTVKEDNISSAAANSSARLKEWNMHHMIFQANYDGFECCKDACIKPQVSVFYKLPVDGKLAVQPQTFGGQLALNF